MNDVISAEFQSVLDADLNRAMQEARARSQAEKELPTLTKAELAELLFEHVGLNKREAKDMVETFFDEIRDALERGEAVKLSGLVISSCVTNPNVLVAILKPVKKFLLLHVVSLLSMPARNSKAWSMTSVINLLPMLPDIFHD